ncbi:hypothetical protein QOZ80_3BG0253710 [Eleusine coracana subsp. coracana]|nr:hypothetical protein QOZ80_3BG0253710 [Eleusine coracana subsp. coracana]
MAGNRALLLFAAALLAAVAFAAVAVSAEDAKPTILTPVAHTPLPSFEGDTPAADDAMDDDDAAPVGAPTGATMTEPKPPLTTTPGAAASDGTGATSGASVLGVAAAHVGAVVAVVAGVFAY